RDRCVRRFGRSACHRRARAFYRKPAIARRQSAGIPSAPKTARRRSRDGAARPAKTLPRTTAIVRSSACRALWRKKKRTPPHCDGVLLFASSANELRFPNLGSEGRSLL